MEDRSDSAIALREAGIACVSPFSDIFRPALAATFMVDQILGIRLLNIPRHPKHDSFRNIGAITLSIRDFNVKRLVRDIWYRPSGGAKLSVPVPQLPGSVHKTRWDIDAKSYFKPLEGLQRIALRIKLVDPQIEFLSPFFAITAKDELSQAMMSYMTVSPGGRVATVWLLYDPAGPTGVAGYNIALSVRESSEDGDPSFSVPIIIDPKVENEG